MNTTLPPHTLLRVLPLAVLSAIALLFAVVLLSAAPAPAAEPPCVNEQLRAEQPFASGLADCRAFEMVSPLSKDDNGVSYISSRAAVSGEAVTYFSGGSFAEPKSALLEGRYLSRRGVGGWSTRNISPPYTDYISSALLVPSFGELLFTPDLSLGVVESRFTPLVEGQPVGYDNFYVANTKTGSYQAVTTVTPEAEYKPFKEVDAEPEELPESEGASTDLDHVVFQHKASLCCGATPGREHVYEWADGKLSLVDVPPGGMKFEDELMNVGSTADFDQPRFYGNPWRAVSDDGSRVIFTAEEAVPRGTLEGQVFVRENPGGEQSPEVGGRCTVVGDACTVEVSASQRTVADLNGAKAPAAWYRDASVDGSRVFFTSRVELTNNAFTGLEDNAANLYEYDFTKPEGERLTDLTVDEADPSGAAVMGVVTASEDGSYVYFVAGGKLTAEKNGEGEEAVAGKPNLYLSHAGEVTFIATLAPTRVGFFHGGGFNQNGDEEDWIGEEGYDNDFGPGQHTARVTPDGSLLAFESERQLTTYDNQPAQPADCKETQGEELSGSNPSISCREVYLYDALTGKLICASCDPNGSRPVGPANLGGHDHEELGSVTTSEPFYLPHNLSDDGGRLFFESSDPLVAYDSNGLLDVYEWERPGEGTCTTASVSYTPSHEGCTFAVSDVAGSFESHFMDASANGSDVFIATAGQLVPSDTDTRVDVYDVRVNGGFPVTSSPPVCVNADSCKPPASPQPGVFGTPASATFSGPGTSLGGTVPPLGASKPKSKTAAQVRAEKLTKALRTCRKRYAKSKKKKRSVCEKQARHRYMGRSK